MMPILSTPPAHRFPWYVRLFFWHQKRRYQTVLEPARLWARTPNVFAALALLYGAFDRRSSPLEPALRSLLMVRVSRLNRCAFCIDLNAPLALQHHLEPDKLAALARFESSPFFSDREKAALSYAEMVTGSDRQPTVTHFEQLRRYFNDEAIIELTGLIAFQNLSSKFNAASGVEPQGFCPLASPPDSRSRPA